jgi:hypothetical protein
VPQRLDRHLAHDGDGRRVQHLADLRADERGADDDPILLVDDQLGLAAGVRGDEGAAGDGARAEGDDLDVETCVASLLLRCPTAATSGSVTTIRGTAR